MVIQEGLGLEYFLVPLQKKISSLQCMLNKIIIISSEQTVHKLFSHAPVGFFNVTLFERTKWVSNYEKFSSLTCGQVLLKKKATHFNVDLWHFTQTYLI